MISTTPFPFPYAQLIAVSLLMLTLTCGFVFSAVNQSYFWATLLTFVSVSSYQALNAVAVELEDPYGADINDLPLLEYQEVFNATLTQLNHVGQTGHVTPGIEEEYATAATANAPFMPTLLCTPRKDSIHLRQQANGQLAESKEANQGETIKFYHWI